MNCSTTLTIQPIIPRLPRGWALLLALSLLLRTIHVSEPRQVCCLCQVFPTGRYCSHDKVRRPRLLGMLWMHLLPGLLTRHLGVGAENAPWVVVPGGVGFVLGSILVGRREGLLSRLAWMGTGMSGVGLGVLLLALAGKVSGELQAIIRRRPKLFAELIRQLRDAPDHAMLRLVREVPVPLYREDWNL